MTRSENGESLVVTARHPAAPAALVSQIEADGGRALQVAGDVKDESLAKPLVEMAVDRFGGLDIAFNNAGGVGETAPASELSVAAWRETLETNLTSAFLGESTRSPRCSNEVAARSSSPRHSSAIPQGSPAWRPTRRARLD